MYDNYSNRLVSYQSHPDFDSESISDLNNVVLLKEDYDNEIYDKLDKERILMKDTTNKIQTSKESNEDIKNKLDELFCVRD